jgi:hypothetical protein
MEAVQGIRGIKDKRLKLRVEEQTNYQRTIINLERVHKVFEFSPWF